MNPAKALFILALILLTGTCALAQQPNNMAAIREKIVEQNAKMVETFKKGDLLGVARFYSDDAMILSYRGLKIQGRAAIDKYWTSIKGGKDWKLDVIEVGGDINTVYQIGRSTFTSERDGKTDSYVCDFIVIWKRQGDGSYRIYVDSFN